MNRAAGGRHPTTATVRRTWGSWNAFIEAGGFTPWSLGETCAKGHPLTPENIYLAKGRYRECRTCSRKRRTSAKYRAVACTYREANVERLRERRRQRHVANPEPDRERIRRWAEENRERRDAMRVECRALITTAKGDRCQRCAGRFPTRELHFHHRDPATRLFFLGRVTIRSRTAILAEIVKCDVLCGPCHAARHRELRNREEAT